MRILLSMSKNNGSPLCRITSVSSIPLLVHLQYSLLVLLNLSWMHMHASHDQVVDWYKSPTTNIDFPAKRIFGTLKNLIRSWWIWYKHFFETIEISSVISSIAHLKVHCEEMQVCYCVRGKVSQEMIYLM